MAAALEVPAWDRLLYKDHKGWAPLPDWGRFLVKLGAALWNWESLGQRAVVCVTLPIRAFASPLAALGAVSAGVSTAGKARESSSAHFEFLARLPPASGVILRKRTQKLKGILMGVEERGGIRYVRVQVESLHARGGGLTEFVREADSLRIRPADFDISSLKLPKSQKGRPVARRATFLESLLDLRDVYDFVTCSSLTCAIVGNMRILRAEIVDSSFAVQVGRRTVEDGQLQDALRVRKFLVEGEACRSEMIPASTSEISVDPLTSMAPVAIFDGAIGYLRWRQEFGSANQLLILDRCQPTAEDAAAAFVQEHAKRKGELDEYLDDPPPGVELAGFIGVSR